MSNEYSLNYDLDQFRTLTNRPIYVGNVEHADFLTFPTEETERTEERNQLREGRRMRCVPWQLEKITRRGS